MRKKLIVGNWKMHGNHPANAELLAAIVAARPFIADVAVCVPCPYLSDAAVAFHAHVMGDQPKVLMNNAQAGAMR